VFKVTPQDCFLVLASWRHTSASIRQELLLDQDSRIMLLDRNDLTSLYTSTLVSRPYLISGSSLVRVENAAPD
jgi:hypothetical protein